MVYRASKSISDLKLDIILIADLALDPYTNHGQDGVLNADGTVDNDKTVKILADAAVVCANSGFDWVAPSDMMDGRVGLFDKLLIIVLFVILVLFPIQLSSHLHITALFALQLILR